MNRLSIIAVTLFSFLWVNALAQEDEAKQIKLTSADVSQFIQSFPSIVEEFEKLDVKYDAEKHEFNISEASDIIEDVNTIVRKHGYKDYSDFYLKTAAISLSYAAAKMEEEDVHSEINAAIRDIEKSDHYTAEQKEQMISMLKQNSQMLESMSKDMADEENIAVVKPYMEQIETAFDIE